MKFFLEGSAYLSSTLKDALGDDLYGTVVKGSPSASQTVVDCVGYCLSRDRKEHIFILPKVFLKDGKAFGFKEIEPKAPIDFSDGFRKELKDNGWDDSVIGELPLYLYLAIDKFRRNSQDSGIAEKADRDEVMSSKTVPGDRIILDIILTLRDFYKDNQNLFTLIYKQTHSGFNKVNWTKTVRTCLPVISGGDIIYPAVVNRKRKINYDEELLVLFFNTLRYINGKYGFRFNVDQPYNLMPDGEFIIAKTKSVESQNEKCWRRADFGKRKVLNFLRA